MLSSTDPGFQAWLATLPALGYDRLWIGHNLPALMTRYQANPSAPMQPCPPPPERARDRYEEI